MGFYTVKLTPVDVYYSYESIEINKRYVWSILYVPYTKCSALNNNVFQAIQVEMRNTIYT